MGWQAHGIEEGRRTHAAQSLWAENTLKKRQYIKVPDKQAVLSQLNVFLFWITIFTLLLFISLAFQLLTFCCFSFVFQKFLWKALGTTLASCQDVTLSAHRLRISGCSPPGGPTTGGTTSLSISSRDNDNEFSGKPRAVLTLISCLSRIMHAYIQNSPTEFFRKMRLPYFLLLECNCFLPMRYFLLYNMKQLYVYIYISPSWASLSLTVLPGLSSCVLFYGSFLLTVYFTHGSIFFTSAFI